MSSRMSNTPASTWKEPVQARSRARVAALLDAALALALELGHLDLKMTHVAERASVPIGSLYQFFPTREALIERLFAREMSAIDQQLRSGLKRAKTLEDIAAGLRAALHRQFKTVQNRPGLALIWTLAAGHPAIRAADLENTRLNADALAERLADLCDASDTAPFKDAALIICHTWGSVISLSLNENEQTARRLLESYAHMIEAQLRALAAKKTS